MTTQRRGNAEALRIAVLALAAAGGMIALGAVAVLREEMAAGPMGRGGVPAPSRASERTGPRGARRSPGSPDTFVVERPLASAGRVTTS